MNLVDAITGFGHFIEKLGIKDLLGFANGLSAIVVILAALLVILAVLRGKVSLANWSLVVLFCMFSVGLVLIDRLRPPEEPATLVLLSARLPEMISQPKIWLRFNSESEWDILSAEGNAARDIKPGENTLSVNASDVKDIIEALQRKVTALGVGLASNTSLNGDPTIANAGG